MSNKCKIPDCQISGATKWTREQWIKAVSDAYLNVPLGKTYYVWETLQISICFVIYRIQFGEIIERVYVIGFLNYNKDK